MIRQIQQQLSESIVRENRWQELVGFSELAHQLRSELGSSNAVQIGDMNERGSSVKENLSVLDKRTSILERNLDVLLSSWSLSSEPIKSKSDLLCEPFPDFVIFVELLVIHVAFVSQNLENVFRLKRSKSVIKQSGLLSGEPSSKIIISAICKSAYKMTNIIVLSSAS